MIALPKRQNMEAQLVGAKRMIEQMPGGEDLYQQVCILCMTYASDRDWDQPQHGFIRTVARRESINMHRKHVARRPFFQAVEYMDSAGDGLEPLDSIVDDERAKIVRRSVEKLGEPYRSASKARFYDGFSSAEIAAKLGIPRNTVKTRLKRARQQLAAKPELQRYSPES
ncbi:RNA polymerase sigma factor [Rosistilla oblonga]|uniref:ECF RNA polymerase sigma factor SigW n=1 Tax=Rosistilla oblonga TaxID=2527990 RepID=A0A518IMD7_9BACT|nr:sigma-70 family RNA polymerase sigma factor [Rosistilla oblonga]QDV54244.1 ECF RNA polymerase sigma factor SigW [Rosistilla oblonga]